MEDDFLEGLNPAQREAVLATEGPCLVVAGAGSGKTRVLTYRIAQLMRQGVKPWQIMALTFTNKAAKEMRERIANVVGDSARSLWMGTFHSMFAKILRQEAELLGLNNNFSIYDTTDSQTLVRQIVKELGLDPKVYKENNVLSRISMAKNNLVSPAAYANDPALVKEDMDRKQSEIYNIYSIYSARCRQASALDFDDLLLYPNILFRDHPERLQHYQQKFRYILVDEFQDTNHAQYRIVRQLSDTHHNVCAVGDDAQSIYSFRGAEIQNILNFKKDYKECKIIKLERNYRSTKTIVNAANSVIAKNEKQIKKVAFSEGDDGERIKLIAAYTDHEEAFRVASSIHDLSRREHCKFADIAILYRTNAQSRALEEALRKSNIPYYIYSGLSFYQRKEVKDLLAYLRLAVNPNDDEALRRVINYPARGIGDTSLQHLQEAANAASQTLWHTIEDLPVNPPTTLKSPAIKKMLEFAELIHAQQRETLKLDAYEAAYKIALASGMLAELRSESNNNEGLTRLQNVEELLNSIKAYVDQRRSEGDIDDTVGLTEYLSNVALITDMDSDDPKKSDCVSMMTVHSSKGLEFDYVYIVGLEENLFPSPRSLTDASALEEERRLFYVAVTRAARRLTISFAQSRMQWGEMRSNQPSRFLKDIDPQYIEMDARMADGLHRDNQQVHSARHQAPSGRPLRSLSSNMRGASQQGNRPPTNSYSSARYAAGPALTAKQLHANMAVLHDRFGQGRVLSVSDDGQMAQVDFGSAGIKNLVLKFANLRAAGQ